MYIYRANYKVQIYIFERDCDCIVHCCDYSNSHSTMIAPPLLSKNPLLHSPPLYKFNLTTNSLRHIHTWRGVAGTASSSPRPRVLIAVETLSLLLGYECAGGASRARCPGHELRGAEEARERERESQSQGEALAAHRYIYTREHASTRAGYATHRV